MNTRRRPTLLLPLILFPGLWTGVGLADQTLNLRANWNLVALDVPPSNPAVGTVLEPLISAGKLVSVWTWDNQTRAWARFPAIPGVPEIATLTVGRGYWIKVTSQSLLTVSEAPAGVPAATGALQPGWNLVSFALDAPMSFDKVLRGQSVDQVWRFQETISKFQGIQISQGTVVGEPDFTELEPGRGYWVHLDSTQASALTPRLATALRGDTDVAPLLPDAAPGQRRPFNPFTPGDFDIGRDGYYDRPDTQRALDFLDSIDVQSIGIANPGAGLLNWRIGVSHPDQTPWLRIRRTDPITGEVTLLESLSGAAATENDLIEVQVDREGLAPGDYVGELTLASNGGAAAFPDDPTRVIPVAMQVDGLGGDYQVRVAIDQVNGVAADLPNPRLFLSLYSDAPTTAADDGRLKGIIDAARTLLFPFDVRMTGSVYQQDSARFIVNGTFLLPLDDPSDLNDGNNPYQTAIRRDITLIGDRRNRADPADSLLGPLDLKGEYRETIRGLRDQPIYLSGSFTALRVTEKPSALDTAGTTCAGVGPDIPDRGLLAANLESLEQLIITDVELDLDLSHSRPTDLRVTLTSPAGERVVLRDQQAGGLGAVTYEGTAVPLQSLTVFRGSLSRLPGQGGNGTWVLKVEDLVGGETGRLNACALRLSGTRAGRISGRVTASSVPIANADLLITGCGMSVIARTGADGTYTFDGLVDCLYQVTLHKDGYQRLSTTVAMQGSDALNINLNAQPAVTTPPVAAPPSALTDGRYTLYALTTLAGAGAQQPRGRLIYAADSGTFDRDRPPFSTGPGNIGDEDTSEFSSTVSTCTKTNKPNFIGVADPCLAIAVGDRRSPLQPDSTIDGPVGTGLHVRAVVSIGGPIIGESVSGNLHLAIGPNP